MKNKMKKLLLLSLLLSSSVYSQGNPTWFNTADGKYGWIGLIIFVVVIYFSYKRKN